MHDDDTPPQSESPEMPSPDPMATANSGGRFVAVGLDDVNPDFLAEWEAMDPEEYAASLRDIPDHILDAAPPDLPEEIWRALKAQDEAGCPTRWPIQVGRCWPRRWPGPPTTRSVMRR
ncbi:MAG: hypothetical protein H0X18_14675 [Geodermatophilaceae bacterium]|nr:hypothetical protein [Geodermatophilaceae bacterium]